MQRKVYRTKERAFKELALSYDEMIECHNATGEQVFVVKLAVESMSRLDAILVAFVDLSDTNTMMVLSRPVDRALPETCFR